MLSRQVKTGHEQPFEAVLRRLAAVVRCQPRHLDAIMLKPCPGGPPSCTIVSYPARRHDAGAWPSSKVQARLAVEAEVHSQDAPQTQYLSGLEGRLAAPGHPGAGPAPNPRRRWSSASRRPGDRDRGRPRHQQPCRSQAMVEQLLAACGRWDNVVNNAAATITRPFPQITEAKFDTSFAVNVTGVLHGLQLAWEHLADNGRIITISSSTTGFMLPGYAVYDSTNGAVEQFAHRSCGCPRRPLTRRRV